MNYFQALILSIVEGITEFLPISSTGHLILISDLLALQQTDFVKTFEIAIQLGAILSVVFLYKDKFINSFVVWRNILIGFVPTAIIGFLLYKFIKNYLLGSTLIVSLALIIGGLVLVAFEFLYKEKKSKTNSLEKISLVKAFFIGVIQSISIIPGVSRAAATILGGLFLGLDRKTAVEFSFLLAVPTMLGATVLDILSNTNGFTSGELSLLLVGFVGSFIFAAVSIKFFVSYIKNNSFLLFGVYRIIIGIIFLLR